MEFLIGGVFFFLFMVGIYYFSKNSEKNKFSDPDGTLPDRKSDKGIGNNIEQ